MKFCPLTAISPLDGRYQVKTTALQSLLSEYGLIKYRLLIEVRWLQTLCQQPEISPIELSAKDQTFLETLISRFDLRQAEQIKDIEKTTNHDVKAIEYYLQQTLAGHPRLKKLIPFIHFGCTSEDINNLAYSLMNQAARDEVILPAIEKVIAQLNVLAQQHAKLPMLARTHGQAASPTTLGKELKNIVVRLTTQAQKIKQHYFTGKFNGAVGNFNAHRVSYPEVDWPTVSHDFIKQLGLIANLHTTQIEPHDNLVEFLQHLLRFNTILIDLNRDIWGYISLNYFQQQKVADEVGSSTMPHKINPIDFENSEGNLGLCNSLIQHFSIKLPISRWQRDLTDSTVLRNCGVIYGYALIAYQAALKGLNKLIANEEIITADLNQHWEVLAEAVQTVMRRHGIEDAYEQLKNFTRGTMITEKNLNEFIKTLAIPDATKRQLLQLTPEKYIGYAIQLTAKDANDEDHAMASK